MKTQTKLSRTIEKKKKQRKKKTLIYLLADQEYMLAMPFPRRKSRRSSTSTDDTQEQSKIKHPSISKTRTESHRYVYQRTSEVESAGGGKRNLHEMRVLELTIPGEIVHNRNLTSVLRLLPHHRSLRAPLRGLHSRSTDDFKSLWSGQIQKG